MTTHDQWTERLSEYVDDELPEDERRQVTEHVAGCAECAATLEDLRSIVAGASALTPVSPALPLWDGIAQRIAVLPPRQTAAPRVSLSLFQLIAASLALIAVSGWAASRFLSRPPAAEIVATRPAEEISRASSASGLAIEFAQGEPSEPVAALDLEDRAYDAAVKELQAALAHGRGALDPATIAVLEDNLAIIDAAVAEARQALLRDPANGYLSGHFIETRRRKLDLLREATSLTTGLN